MGNDAQRDLVRQVQDLRGPNESNDLASVFFDALELMKAELERRKCAKTDRPRRMPGRRRTGGRLIPAAVRREVWERDGHRCAFVGENGHRCEARRGLECDHILPVARGSESTVANVRLLCRTHNQFEAERVFGREFMEGKREQAREKSEARAEAENQALAQAEANEQLLDVVAALKGLGIPVERARWAADAARAAGASLEQHIRAALKLLRPKSVTVAPMMAASMATPNGPATTATSAA
jgi:5-methylcytosine-specific restriction endonuclease McrA